MSIRVRVHGIFKKRPSDRACSFTVKSGPKCLDRDTPKSENSNFAQNVTNLAAEKCGTSHILVSSES